MYQPKSASYPLSLAIQDSFLYPILQPLNPFLSLPSLKGDRKGNTLTPFKQMFVKICIENNKRDLS